MLRINDFATTNRLFEATKGMSVFTCTGIDKMNLVQFREGLTKDQLGDELIESLCTGAYQPQPLLKVSIPKSNGGFRNIYIPTVTDRAIQRMIVKGITPVTESRFSSHSHGFRLRRGIQSAVGEASRLIREGYSVCVLIDLENFFGNMDRERLRKLLRDYPLDETTRTIINRFIKAPVVMGDRLIPCRGIPAGIPLAPCLANIYLHPLDRMLEREGIKFVRYADDITLFFRTEEECSSFINQRFWRVCEEGFKILINHQKTNRVISGCRLLLGYGIDDYGGVSYREWATDNVREAFTSLLNDPQISLNEIKVRVNQILTSTLSMNSIVDNLIDLKRNLAAIAEKLIEWMSERFSKLELLFAAGIKLERIRDHVFYSSEEAIYQILPALNLLK